jgi:sigma-B regulation protein RsbU (phosphoserine phosphatase)
MEEAVVNVMNYAYPSGTYGELSITAQSNDIRLKFVIIDNGTPFDPTTHKEVDTTLSAEERGIGGLGIHLVREIMDSINYERINGQNILRSAKNSELLFIVNLLIFKNSKYYDNNIQRRERKFRDVF